MKLSRGKEHVIDYGVLQIVFSFFFLSSFNNEVLVHITSSESFIQDLVQLMIQLPTTHLCML